MLKKAASVLGIVGQFKIVSTMRETKRTNNEDPKSSKKTKLGSYMKEAHEGQG
jgi:hypothetical protein